jgi:hypothetical protein
MERVACAIAMSSTNSTGDDEAGAGTSIDEILPKSPCGSGFQPDKHLSASVISQAITTGPPSKGGDHHRCLSQRIDICSEISGVAVFRLQP